MGKTKNEYAILSREEWQRIVIKASDKSAHIMATVTSGRDDLLQEILIHTGSLVAGTLLATIENEIFKEEKEEEKCK